MPVYPLPCPGGLTQHTFAQASQAEIGSLEGLTPLLVQRQFLALDEDGATALQHALGGALHHQHVPRVPRVLQRVDGQLWAGEGAILWAGSMGRGGADGAVGGALTEEPREDKVVGRQVLARGLVWVRARGVGRDLSANEPWDRMSIPSRARGDLDCELPPTKGLRALSCTAASVAWPKGSLGCGRDWRCGRGLAVEWEETESEAPR